jgi:hypothetical protein
VLAVCPSCWIGLDQARHAAAIGADKIDPGALPWLVGAFSAPRRPELPSANRLSWRSCASALRRALSSDGLRHLRDAVPDGCIKNPTLILRIRWLGTLVFSQLLSCTNKHLLSDTVLPHLTRHEWRAE